MPTLVACTPAHLCDPRIAIAALRAGEIGILDLGYAQPTAAHRTMLRDLADQAERYTGSWGVRWDVLGDSERSPEVLAGLIDRPWPYLVLSGVGSFDPEALRATLSAARRSAAQIWLEVCDVAQAQAAQTAGFDGVIVCGHEGGGFVSHDSSYLLIQQLAHLGERWTLPFWVRGGIGFDTAAAAIVGGAAGVVLGEQLWLSAEAPFSAAERAVWRQFDGSETATVEAADRTFRFLCRTDRSVLQELERIAASGGDVKAAIAERLRRGSTAGGLVPLGQDLALAAKMAGRGLTVSDICKQLRLRIETNLRLAQSRSPLTVDGPLAGRLGTKYPILQGPMTRVSDTAAFCAAVAENGALPFLALAVMSGGESGALLQEAKAKLAQRPWGVGVLGFIPGEMRDAQDAAIAEAKPPFAIIAGGRPSQAARFEKLGISTFLHVPSPGLLETFIADGARKFIFEGRECGGHVGPRPSFLLWQQQIEILLSAEANDAGAFQIIFAGGVHDGLSAAMVAAAAARLVDRGMNVGVLMGTSYLFTPEAVACGAVTEEFQRQALDCRETVLLESGVGHATRCARTEFAEEFNAYKRELILAGKTSDQIRLDLELFNIGRLRIASKGVTRKSDPARDGKSELVGVDVEEQRRTGMYMIGQIAALRDRVVPMAELHARLIDDCATHLQRAAAGTTVVDAVPNTVKKVAASPDEPIAIVGMAGMFPKAADVRKFWANIFQRIDAVTEVSPERWSPDVNFNADRLARDTVYSKWGGFLDEVRFDPFRWRIPPATLSSIEPIQLLSLETAWNAFRDAGYDHRPFPRERTSVIFGIAGPHDLGLEYSFRTMAPHYLTQMSGLTSETVDGLLKTLRSELVEWTEDSFPGFLSNVVAGRIANRLDLGGTNFIVDAACAASLAALHTAIAQLRLGWSDVVLLGTADGSNNLFTFQSFSKTHALSPRGRSRPFDDSADGIAIGEAVAALVLKRLSDAERDGDQIYAVIRGIGSSSDGNNRSLTAPHPPAQVLAIRRAYADAQLDSATVSLVEAHGTGTAVGDRSEIQALVEAFSQSSKMRQGAAVGSIKSMIGHTKTAAGVVGVVKTALALRHRVLPPTIGVDTPNKLVDFTHSPFYVNTDVRPWFRENGDHPRRAGVSAFGFGGTNFHVVMEEYDRCNRPASNRDLTPRAVELFCWRRATRDELLRDLRQLQRGFASAAPEDLIAFGASCWAAERRRPQLANGCRLAIVATSGADLVKKLERAIEKLPTSATFADPAGIYFSTEAPIAAGEVCFLYPGQGSQAVGMLRDLVAISPWSLELFERWNRLLASHLSEALTRYIYPPPAFSDEEREARRRALIDTRVAQPALGVVELFATQLLQKYRLAPAFAAGHSYGEYAALYAADSIESDDLTAISAVRGRVSAEAVSTCPGAMAAVQLGADALQPILDELRLNVVIANRNSPQQAVVAGSTTNVDEAVTRLKERGLRATRLAVSAPFHTPAMATAINPLAAQLAMTAFRSPQCAVYANTTGERYPTDPEAMRALLKRHMIEPVCFDRQIERMHADGARLFLEVGPGRALTGLVGQILADKPHAALSLDAAGRDGVTQLGHVLATIVSLGLPIALDAWYEGRADEDRSPADFLRSEAAARETKPTDVIVGPGGIRPVKRASAAATVKPTSAPPPVAPALAVASKQPLAPPSPASPSSSVSPKPTVAEVVTIPTPKPLPAAAPAAPFVSTPKSSPSSSTQSAMSISPVNSDKNESLPAPIAYAPGAASDAATCQAMIGQWLELQLSQTRLNERFLHLQERLLFGEAGTLAPPRVASAPPPMPALRSVVEMPQAPAPAPASPAASVRMTPRSTTPAAITLPAKVLEPQTEERLLRPTPAAAPVPATPAPVVRSTPVVAAAPSGNGHGAAIASTNGHATAAAQATPAAAGDQGPPSTEQFSEDLLRVVSERTGYPIEMLDKDVPLEAGLGIDSIKTVEVFSKLKPYHAYFQRPDQDEEETLKVFTRLKTLRDIEQLYDEQRNHYLSGDFGAKRPSAPSSAATTSVNGSSVKRFELEAVEAVAEGDEKKNRLNTIL